MLSSDARTLCDLVRDLEGPLELTATPSEAERVTSVLRHATLDELGERGLWNLLFAAGELSRRVDVYRAHELFLAATALVERAAVGAEAGSPRAVTLEMGFDFFFARGKHPLLSLRAGEVVDALGRLLGRGARPARRAAIHGLGHVIEHGEGQPWLDAARAELDALGDADAELLRYAQEARTGVLR